ncbi:hypothetical protein G7Y79_00018g045060 [Physcia stellaris]|nr:hypothetical protein G7Y79_00018g045060 [Physcia stellaris]
MGSQKTLARAARRHRAKERRTTKLPDLPTEIQLQILEACLVSDSGTVHVSQHNLFYGDPATPTVKASNNVNLNILRTCRLFREEGLKVFFQRNHFIVSSALTKPEEIGDLSLSFGHVPPIKHLTLKYSTLYGNCKVVQAALDAFCIANRLPILEILKVQLDARERNSTECTEGSCNIFRNSLRSSRRAYRNAIKPPEEWGSAPKSQIRRIVIKKVGLPEVGLMTIQLLSALLMEGGWLGIENMGVGYEAEEDEGQGRSSGCVRKT